MIRKRNFGTVVAVGGLTAAIALLTGLPSSARADELSDLRANQVLLQQRVDQLAQADTALPNPSASLAGSFPRSFLIPGTDTSIAITGFAVLDTEYYMSGGAASGNATNDLGEFGALLSTPVGGKGGAGHSFTMTPYESRVHIETQTPTQFGPATTVIEFDFSGGQNPADNPSTAPYFSGSSATLHPGESLTPRLRLAYGTLGPILAGQAYSMSLDLDSHTDVIDFGGDVTTGGTVRVPQLRYTYTGANGFSASADIEDPDTNGWTAAGAADNSSGATVGTTAAAEPFKNNIPDFFGNLNWTQPWGHLRTTAVVRDLEFQEGPVSKQFIGAGGWITGSVLPGLGYANRDFLGFGATGGQGMGRYIGNQYDLSTNFAGVSTQPAASIIVDPTTSYGGYIGYKHWWADEWASDFSGGVAETDYNSILLGATSDAGANKLLVTTHLNLFYYPTSFAHVGVEWFYGHRKVVNNETGNLNAILTEFMVKF